MLGAFFTISLGFSQVPQGPVDCADTPPNCGDENHLCGSFDACGPEPVPEGCEECEPYRGCASCALSDCDRAQQSASTAESCNWGVPNWFTSIDVVCNPGPCNTDLQTQSESCEEGSFAKGNADGVLAQCTPCAVAERSATESCNYADPLWLSNSNACGTSQCNTDLQTQQESCEEGSFAKGNATQILEQWCSPCALAQQSANTPESCNYADPDWFTNSNVCGPSQCNTDLRAQSESCEEGSQVKITVDAVLAQCSPCALAQQSANTPESCNYDDVDWFTNSNACGPSQCNTDLRAQSESCEEGSPAKQNADGILAQCPP
jgi:hypothetical protein